MFYRLTALSAADIGTMPEQLYKMEQVLDDGTATLLYNRVKKELVVEKNIIPGGFFRADGEVKTFPGFIQIFDMEVTVRTTCMQFIKPVMTIPTSMIVIIN